jgi:hypothetical protein
LVILSNDETAITPIAEFELTLMPGAGTTKDENIDLAVNE